MHRLICVFAAQKLNTAAEHCHNPLKTEILLTRNMMKGKTIVILGPQKTPFAKENACFRIQLRVLFLKKGMHFTFFQNICQLSIFCFFTCDVIIYVAI